MDKNKNDDLKNGSVFVFDLFLESTCLHPNKAGMSSVLVLNFSELAALVKVLCGGNLDQNECRTM